MKTDNPATRILKVLRAIENCQSATLCKKAWSAALGVEDGNDSLLLIKIGTFMSAPIDAVTIMNNKFPTLASQTNAWHKKFTTAMIHQNLSAPISTFTDIYKDSCNDYLEVMSQMIGTASYEEVPEEEVLEARSTLANLIEEILKSDLEEKVKNYLVKSIRRIITALEDYELNGTIPVIESIEIMAGHVFTNEQFRTSMNSDIGNKIFGIIGAIADAMAIVSGVPPTLWKQIGSSFVGRLTSE